MASVRNHIRIARSPDDVWRVVSDADALADWAPTVDKSSASGKMRHVEFSNGLIIEEEIITSDDELRRFQYVVVEQPVELDTKATVDVIEDGDGALVIYSTELLSDDVELERVAAEWVTENSAGFLRGLKEYLER